MSYHSLLYHIVFRPHKSARVITEAYEREVYACIYSYIKDKGYKLLRINGMPDHIHMLISLPPSICLSDFVRDIKMTSSKFMKDHKEKFPYFEGWAKSYAVLSYSMREKDMIVNYIKNQKEHHKRVSFADELRQLLTEEGIPIDEQYFLK